MVNVTCSVSPCNVVLELPILSLSLEDAALIGTAILLVWSVAFAFRLLIKTVRVDESVPDET